MRLTIKLTILLMLVAGSLFAGEGKWTPQQVLEIDPAWLAEQGLELPPEKLWDPERGTGLLAATVRTPGCTGAFVSATGLVVTNHHCLFGLIQEHSTPENDLLANGFLAKSRDAELVGKTMYIEVPRRFTDVTALVEKFAAKATNDGERWKRIDRTKKEMVEKCERQPNMRCSVVAFDGGVRYTLVENVRYLDVRLVWAPPRSVGEYGGEIDNWMWPRHTGDFSMARVYASKDGKPAPPSDDNVPLAPEFYFPLSKKGVSPDDFVMVLGFPGSTFRSYIAADVALRREAYYPARIDLYGEWIEIMETLSEGSAEGSLAVSSSLKSLHNRHKNARGQIAGLDRGSIVTKRRKGDAEVRAWAEERDEWANAIKAYEELDRAAAKKRETFDRDFLVENLRFGAKSLYFSKTLVRNARERLKDDLDRDSDYQDRNQDRLRRSLDRQQRNIFVPVDKKLLSSIVERALALDDGTGLDAIDATFGDLDEVGITKRIEEFYAGTKVLDLDERKKMFDETPKELAARKDPMIDLAFELDDQLEVLDDEAEVAKGRTSRLLPEWRRAVMAHAGKPIAPDANRSLRVSFAHVKGYAPRDGVFQIPQTTLSGVVAKHTGEEPFDVPTEILEAAGEEKFGPWRDKALGDVPVGFLANGDTTGGNSGSPVVNGRGELVGVNFDRVWENVANDFGYNPDIARNVSVDIRYMLWILDQVQGAKSLLGELGVK